MGEETKRTATGRIGYLGRYRRRLGMTGLLLGLCASTAGGMAQDKAEAMPVFKDARTIEEPLNTDTGAEFQLGKDILMRFPVGLPVGRSRLVTLKRGKSVSPKQVAPGFSPLGPTLDFNGALATADRPIEVAWTTKKDPQKAGKKLVLAMEIGTFCEDHNKKYKLKSGLCSGWEMVEARYDAATDTVRAKLDSTGGLRLQFGMVSEDAAP